MGVGGTGGLPLPDTGLDTARFSPEDSARYDELPDRRGRQQRCRLRPGGGRELPVRLLVRDAARPGREQFQAEQEVATFSGAVDTACGGATSDVGPFYCPVDSVIYLDTTFFDDVLQQQLNGPSGAFVEPYVLAHEYGHHIQNLLGTMGQVRTQQGPESDAVRLELQADCYAGMWAGSATSTDDASGEALISDLTDEDVQQAVAAAKAVGDDRIQQQTTGRVNPEGWTHGSAAQRVRWFTTGYEQGSLEACDTFSASSL